MFLRLCAVLLAAVSSLAAADTLYRWTDKDGGIHYTDLPPQFEVKRLEVRQMGTGNYVETSQPSYALSKAQKNFPVTLYAAPDCSAECKTAREFLGKRGIAFSEVSVNSEAAVTAVQGGIRRQHGHLSARAHRRQPEDEGVRTSCVDPHAGRGRLSEGRARQRASQRRKPIGTENAVGSRT